jgi:hypothetical protein
MLINIRGSGRRSTPSASLNICHDTLFILILIIYFIKKIKVMKINQMYTFVKLIRRIDT